MKKVLVLLVASLLLAGCHLVPKTVELGQRKVTPVPVKSAAAAELDRQAADYTARQIGRARDAALLESSSTNVVAPLSEARDAAVGLRYSLGSPARPWADSGAELALRMGALEAKLDKALDQYRAKVAPDVGKKIEGTGLVRVPYFLWLGGTVGALFLLWGGLKLVGVLYPPVGIGVNGLSAVGRVGAGLLNRGFHQLLLGGERFKAALEKSEIPAEMREKVLELFRSHQMGAQDGDVQNLIRSATR